MPSPHEWNSTARAARQYAQPAFIKPADDKCFPAQVYTSGVFALQLGSLASFDARISQLPSRQRVVDYFRWRAEDAHRNALNAHCYWLLRQQGRSARVADAQLAGLSIAAKNELLFQHGVNFNELPAWHKRGVGLVRGRTLDYGCGYGLDAATFGWEAYDPYYHPIDPVEPYDTIVCILVLNALSRANRARVIERIRALLAADGRAYLAVARDLPITGKLGMHHSLQKYVLLTLPTVFEDERVAIYALEAQAVFTDRTRDYLSRRDRRRHR